MGGEKGRKSLWPERDRQTACVLIMAILYLIGAKVCAQVDILILVSFNWTS
jgi:hypothetical protein